VAALIHTRFIRQLAFVAYVASLVLLVLVLVVGTAAKGAERWLVLGPLRMQPSDPAKLALILAIARYCSINWPSGGYSIITLVRPLNISRPIGFLGLMVFILVKSSRGSEFLSDQLLTSKLGMAMMVSLLVAGVIWLFLALLKLYQTKFQFEALIAPIDIPLAPFLLIAVEPDLGTGLIVLAVAGIMLLFIGIERMSLMIGFLGAAGVSVLAYFTLLRDYQKQRIISFLNPEADAKGEGYHAMQSIIAIGSGRLTGKGYSGGTQTQLSFLPENATDFVFSVWAEEWGFVACVFLLSLYFMLLWSILKIAAKVEDQFSQLVCIGVCASIFIHVFINVGMVTGILPVVGVPLPLMSFGGSSLNITLIGIGLVVNVAIWRGQK
jgi:cell division protein FtsW (lipid II flippase)